MGKILFLSDIHGNMPAMYALENEIKKIDIDEMWFVGDAVGKGPEGDKAVDWVRKNCTNAVKGNWDEGICNNYRNRAYENQDFYWKQLGKERIEWLEGLPYEREILISGLWFRVVHGRPSDRLYQAYDSFEELKQGFKSKITDRIYNGYICADSHMPYMRTCDLGYAVNTGSVGNGIGIPRAHCVVIEGEIGSEKKAPLKIDILSVPYDNNESVRIAKSCKEMVNPEAYINEVLTGVYSR